MPSKRYGVPEDWLKAVCALSDLTEALHRAPARGRELHCPDGCVAHWVDVLLCVVGRPHPLNAPQLQHCTQTDNINKSATEELFLASWHTVRGSREFTGSNVLL